MIYSGFHYDSAVCINHIPSNIEIVIRGRSLHKCKNIALHILKNKLYAMEHIDKLIFNRYDYVLCDDMQYPNDLYEYRKMRRYDEVETKEFL